MDASIGRTHDFITSSSARMYPNPPFLQHLVTFAQIFKGVKIHFRSIQNSLDGFFFSGSETRCTQLAAL